MLLRWRACVVVKADIQWLRLISSNGSGGYNESVYKNKHFFFRANNCNANERNISK